MTAKDDPNPVDIHVGARLKSRRSLLRYSQEKLADSVGITFQQVQKYERGTNRISASRLWQFAQILQVPVSYFFENFSNEDSKSAGIVRGLADKEQEGFASEDDVMQRKETLELIREYYSITDAKLRKDLLKMIKSMAASMREDGE